ncbi:zinc ribbon domain-containing protein [Hydrogenophaga sp. BPS33]|uniref:zinc ribbon domain-containing protein n=1 Tax=Hydrogenophaga sp. BPS33 TaxID=2651974 RepID=UPI001320142F|nr:zinc ribbon domain-containing protein [Hydrogenophaga sp. BPS33]QHE83995.1 serine endopeptidase [Hydrogenophaga sp. BPS33]
MGKALRWSEKWFRRGLWLVAFLFAWFLVGLGGTIVGDLPQVEQRRTLDDFLDPQRAPALKRAVEDARRTEREAQSVLEQAQLRQQTAQANHRAARDTFGNWLATRNATQRPEQDPELIERTRQLDGYRQAERDALAAVEAQQQAALNASQAQQRAQEGLQVLEDQARDTFMAAQRAQELRVFLYRLALTLPLLVVAGWLFAKQRKSTYWPFVWGFIFFALFAFFVELMPYLPSYGGYVRYIVGIVLTVIGGRYAIAALQRYLERQQQAEALPDRERRQELDYDLAQARLAKSVCPGCERPLDLRDPKNDFCAHCGMGLHNHCVKCNARKNAFTRYCYACGEPSARMDGAAPAG